MLEIILKNDKVITVEDDKFNIAIKTVSDESVVMISINDTFDNLSSYESELNNDVKNVESVLWGKESVVNLDECHSLVSAIESRSVVDTIDNSKELPKFLNVTIYGKR